VARSLPHEDIAYLGDTARVPYGTRSPETVRAYAKSNARFLADLGLKALVVACNTASAVALDELAETIAGPVLGVVEPGARAAVEATRTGSIAVLATATTIESGAYSRAMAALDPAVRVTSLACPLFVPLAEEGWTEGDVPKAVAERYLADLAGTGVDTIVLGCTHYPLLAPVIRTAAEGVLDLSPVLVDSAAAVAASLVGQLPSPPERAAGSRGGRRAFYVTDGLPSFRRVAPRFFGQAISDVTLVDVGS
jgi:glutamate racemase